MFAAVAVVHACGPSVATTNHSPTDSDHTAGQGAAVRVILVTGKGGVGKTTLSAATAVAAARQGARTLLVSTDAAHSVCDVIDRPLGAEPEPVAPRFDAVQLDGRHELQRSWASIADYLHRTLGWAEIHRLQVDELMVVPGLDQLVALARLRTLVRDDRWDVIVVDCAPSADSLACSCCPTSCSGTSTGCSARTVSAVRGCASGWRSRWRSRRRTTT